MVKSFYAVLDVPRTATSNEIKARFRELVREKHPDRFHGEEKARAEAEFQDISEAFNTLMDPSRRRQHDLELDRPEQAAHQPQKIEKVYLSRGIRAYKQKNFLEAADNFDRATKAAPDNAQAWHHLALAAMQEKRWWPKAQEAIEQACKLEPEKVSYLKLAGKIFAQAEMTSRAKQYYNRALRSGGPDPSIRKALAALGESSGSAPPDGKPAGAAGSEREASDGGDAGKAKSRLFRKIW